MGDGKLAITVAQYGWRETGTGDNTEFEFVSLNDNEPASSTANDATRKDEIDLTGLLAKEGAEYILNGGKQIDAEREKIEELWGKLAVLIDSDHLEIEQANRWEQVRDALRTNVFSASVVGADSLPESVEGDHDPNTALDDIQDMLEVLSSGRNLEEALDPDENGYFLHDDDTPFSTRAAADIWAEKDSQVRAWIGTTNFTRFGVWRVRTTQKALRSGGWGNREMETFGYSPLPGTQVTGVDSPNYTPGGSATYEGGTVA